MSLNLVVIDDDSMFRSAITTTLLSLKPDLSVAEFENPADVDVSAPADVVLLDYHIPGTSFEANLQNVKRKLSAAKVVVISADESAQKILEAIDLGAAGFVPKSSNPALMLAALKLILAGQTYLPPQVLSFRPPQTVDAIDAYAQLSSAQRRVLDQVLIGKSNKVIAIELELAMGTVKSHLSSAYKALGVANRTEAVLALGEVVEASGGA